MFPSVFEYLFGLEAIELINIFPEVYINIYILQRKNNVILTKIHLTRAFGKKDYHNICNDRKKYYIKYRK